MSKNKWINVYEYRGPSGVKLDQTECELYDDMPVESVEEMVLKVMAGGQISERQKRSAYYDVDNELVEPDDIQEDEPDGYDEPDYEQLYKDMRLRKINQWRATKGLEPIQVQEDEPPAQEQEPNLESKDLEQKSTRKKKVTTIEEDVE